MRPSRIPQRLVPLALAAQLCVGGAVARAAEAAGSGLDDQGIEASREIDERGLSLLVPARRRSPSGLLYPYPYEPPDWSKLGRIEYRGFVEAGYFGNADRDRETRFEEHVDWSDGLLLRDFFLDVRGDGGGRYAHFEGGAAGRDDAFYRAEIGRRGWLRLGLFYDEVPHVVANDARSLYAGIGSERLRLPPPLAPGASSLAAIDAALDAAGERTLEIERSRAGVNLVWRAAPQLSLTADYRRERREGERPFGGSIFFSFVNPSPPGPQNNGSVIETIAPVDSLTHDFGAGLQYAGARLQLNLSYRGSAFESDPRELRWENPFPLPGLPVAQGRAALEPDNRSHALRGDLALALPAQGRWTLSLGWNRMTQDEALLPGTINPAFPDWNGRDSLARGDADARVETTLLDSSLQLRPARPLTARLHLRYFERDDHTHYAAFNPRLGSYGYVAEDGRFGVIPRYARIAYDYARLLGEGSLVWRTPLGANLELEYAHEDVDRKRRARDTREDVGRVSLVSRRLGPATLRLAYELRGRRGSTYDPTRDAAYYSQGPPDFDPAPLGTPLQSLREFRQPDLADRRQQEVQARLSLALGSAVDLSVAGKLRNADYRSDWGLDYARARELNLELGWQPSPRLDLHAFGSVERRLSRLESINADPFVIPGPGVDLSAGGALFPLENAWSADSDGTALGMGAGFRARLSARLVLSGDYSWLRSRDELDYAYDPAGGALARNTGPADAGRRLPNLRLTDQVLRLAADLRLSARWKARVFYRLEHSDLYDPQQRGLAPRVRRVLYLAHVDENFTAHVVGAAVGFRF